MIFWDSYITDPPYREHCPVCHRLYNPASALKGWAQCDHCTVPVQRNEGDDHETDRLS